MTRATLAELIPLEDRKLFAVATNDFFPLAPGNTWSYTATYDGRSATIRRAMASSPVFGKPTVRVEDKVTISGQSGALSRWYTGGSAGLKLYRQTSGETLGTVNIPSGLHTFGTVVGDVTPKSWSKVAIDATLNIPDYGTINVSGTDTGASTVRTLARLDLSGWVFTNVKETRIDHTQVMSKRVEGVDYTLTARTIEQAWLVGGIGMVKGAIDVSVNLAGGGESESETIRQSFTLSSATLLQSFALVKDGALRVGGSAGNDTIAVGYDTPTTLLAMRNGIGRVFSTTGISRIIVDGAAGNDTITIIKAGTFRTVVSGGTGNDYLTTGRGRDLLYGGDGNDTLVSGTAADTIYGDAGNDIINGLSGADSLNGGTGTDTTKLDSADVARIAIEVLV